jgi:hypothetical protein
MNFLRSLDSDATFDQSKASRVKEWTAEGKPVVCADLSNATDRFPVLLQVYVLSRVLGNGFGEAWNDLVCGRPFLWQGKQLFYKVGTPMGTLTSWSVFAITHHLVVRLCLLESGVPPHLLGGSYLILGDDIAFVDLQ